MTGDEWVLAIDFGTTATVAASRVGDRPPEVIEIDGERRVPSVVLVGDDGQLVVGRAADELGVARPNRVVRAVKLRLGDPVPVVLAGRPYPAASLAAEVLAKVYDEALRHHGTDPTAVRLTHPAAWGSARCQQLLRAAELAGLPAPALVPEPIAAALAYADFGILRDGDAVLVYDLGGGTLDLALLRLHAGRFELLGHPGGDPRLGGELFDELLAEHLARRLGVAVADHLTADDSEPWRQAAGALRREARRAKELVSTHATAEVLLPLPTGLVSLRVDRDEYEALIAPYVDESACLAARLVLRAGLEPSDVRAVYLAGGSTRAASVQRAVADAFPSVEVSRRGDPKAAVALGATHPLAAAVAVVAPAEVSTVDREARTVIRTGEAPAGEVTATAALTVTAGPAAGARFTLMPGAMVLGRDPTGALALDDPALSRRHALLTVVDGRLWIEDAGSRNGTLVDGEVVAGRREVAPGSVIEAGASLLRYDVPGARVQPATPLAPIVLPSPTPGEPFASAVTAAAASIGAAARAEAMRREERWPGIADVIRRAEAGERGGEDPWTVRVGWSDDRLPVDVTIGPGGDAAAGAWARDVIARAAVLASVPVAVDLAGQAVVLGGDRALARGGARWIVVQLIARHRPGELAVQATGGDAGEWAWLTAAAHYRTDAPHRLIVEDGAQVRLTLDGATPAVTLTYEPTPARLRLDGRDDLVMADVVTAELARTVTRLAST